MATIDPKQLIDITLLGVFQEEVNSLVEGKETALNTTIGTLPEGHDNVIAYINSKVEEVNSNAGDLEAKVLANETAIGKKAEGDNAATGLYKYTDDAAKKAVDDLRDNAPADFDTFKEVAQYISTHGEEAAQLQIDITNLIGTEADDETVNSIYGAKAYAQKAVADKNVSAEGETGDNALVEASAANNKVTIKTTQKTKDAIALAETSMQSVGKGTSVESLVTISVDGADDAHRTVAIDDSALVEKIGAASTTAPTGMYADMQGKTNLTVADVNDKVDSYQLATEAAVRGLFSK